MARGARGRTERPRSAARTRAVAARGPGRPAGRTGDATRERVLATALDTFARDGFAGASMRDIAKRARIRVSSLYHYFPSKEALYGAVLARLQDEMRDVTFGVMSKGHDLRGMAREVIGRLFDFLLANRAYVRLGFRHRLDGVALLDRRVTDRWLGLMDGLMKPAELQGIIKGVDPGFLLVTVDGLVHWHIANEPFYRDLFGKGFGDAELARRAREHVTQVVMRTMGLD